MPQRIVRKIPGNGPVEDLSLIDVQCNGYSAGGQAGSAPAPIYGTVAAGAQVALNWTTWPSDSHKVSNCLSASPLVLFKTALLGVSQIAYPTLQGSL